MISENSFVEDYIPSEMMTFSEAKDYIADKGLDNDHLWSIIECDCDAMIASAGIHVVNVIGFVVTETAWEDENEEAIWMGPRSALIYRENNDGTLDIRFSPDGDSSTVTFVANEDLATQAVDSGELTGMDFMHAAINRDNAGNTTLTIQSVIGDFEQKQVLQVNIEGSEQPTYDGGVDWEIFGLDNQGVTNFEVDENDGMHHLKDGDIDGTFGFRDAVVPFKKEGNKLTIGTVSMTFENTAEISPR